MKPLRLNLYRTEDDIYRVLIPSYKNPFFKYWKHLNDGVHQVIHDHLGVYQVEDQVQQGSCQLTESDSQHQLADSSGNRDLNMELQKVSQQSISSEESLSSVLGLSFFYTVKS